mmetsp:Transcript_39009/g.91688  ORF Transcript_39009/g.91688 Transcript_39009/m.91688 type:complete len:235 (+) Transcript_39009:104-808(+)
MKIWLEQQQPLGRAAIISSAQRCLRPRDSGDADRFIGTKGDDSGSGRCGRRRDSAGRVTGVGPAAGAATPASQPGFLVAHCVGGAGTPTSLGRLEQAAGRPSLPTLARCSLLAAAGSIEVRLLFVWVTSFEARRFLGAGRRAHIAGMPSTSTSSPASRHLWIVEAMAHPASCPFRGLPHSSSPMSCPSTVKDTMRLSSHSRVRRRAANSSASSGHIQTTSVPGASVCLAFGSSQ